MKQPVVSVYITEGFLDHLRAFHPLLCERRENDPSEDNYVQLREHSVEPAWVTNVDSNSK